MNSPRKSQPLTELVQEVEKSSIGGREYGQAQAWAGQARLEAAQGERRRQEEELRLALKNLVR